MTQILAKIMTLFASFKIGLATNFSAANDPGNPVPYAACLHRDLRDSDVVVAHRTLPCGSKIWIYNLRTHCSVIARVGDRGPRHADLDLNVATAKALHANGWEEVLFVPLIKGVDFGPRMR